jgi:hypothetical protein
MDEVTLQVLMFLNKREDNLIERVHEIDLGQEIEQDLEVIQKRINLERGREKIDHQEKSP